MSSKLKFFRELVLDAESKTNNGADKAYLERLKNMLNLSDQVSSANDEQIVKTIEDKLQSAEEERKSVELVFNNTINDFAKKSEKDKLNREKINPELFAPR
jgi:hypothetical protein